MVEWAAAMRRRGLSPATIQRRGYELRSWSGLVGERWRWATRQDVEAWIDSRPLGVRARYSSISHLHAFYRWARREGLTTVDPTELVERPRLDRRLPRPARPGAVARAIGDGSTTWELASALAALAGLRCIELARLTWDDVDQVDGVLWVRGKGDRDRVVPISRQLRPILAAHDGSAGPVLGRRMTAQRVSQLGNEHLRRVGADCTMHQLRHSFATRLLRIAGDVAVVQQALGHASLSTTQIYAAVAPEAVAEAIARW